MVGEKVFCYIYLQPTLFSNSLGRVWRSKNSRRLFLHFTLSYITELFEEERRWRKSSLTLKPVFGGSLHDPAGFGQEWGIHRPTPGKVLCENERTKATPKIKSCWQWVQKVAESKQNWFIVLQPLPCPQHSLAVLSHSVVSDSLLTHGL